jgi:hypothetical protein
VKRIVSVLLLGTLVVGLCLGPQATAMQSGSVPCECHGFVSPTFFSNPVIASATQSGSVSPGRCHKDPSCPLSAVTCQANLQFRVEAKPPFTPYFRMTVNGVAKLYTGNFATYTPTFEGQLPCGQTALIQITANDELVLTAVVECFDCN